MIVEIHEPDIRDIPVLASAAFAAWEQGVAPHVSEAARAKMNEVDFSDFIRRDPEQVLAAYLDGQPVGFVATEYGDGYISDLWVDPNHEGKGVGRALLGAIFERITSRDLDSATLEVLTANTRALELYQHLGFVISWQGMRPDGYLSEPLHKTGMLKALKGI